MSHKSYAQIAKAMYEAYRESMQCECHATGVIFGTRVVPWDDIGVDQFAAWIEAAKKAAAELALVH
ncbi:hypothetical protein [Limnohabitans sp.]|uniref:hypothetical protein n=1 Tax=Limnohabitans sp. TaxID=1907725 RepID=UPI00286F96FD|nr:hypothetical protein [Limnohabitans sp.]